MARLARVKAENSGAFYHLCGKVAGVIGDYPLNDKRICRKIVDFIRLFSKVYCCSGDDFEAIDRKRRSAGLCDRRVG